MEPVSHFFYSDRLKLQFWDFGQEDKPPIVLVHGGMDHARNWDYVARYLREEYHVYALELRGHGNSAWAPGASYTLAEYVLDLSIFLDVIRAREPIRLVGHSLGGIIVTHYAGVYPERAYKIVNIEGLGFPVGHKIHQPLSQRMRRWMDARRSAQAKELTRFGMTFEAAAGVEKKPGMESRIPRSYPNLASAVARMKEANPRLSDEVARHLTLHGTNFNRDGSLIWKFDNYVRNTTPYGTNVEDAAEVFSHIACPVLLCWGTESFWPLPHQDPRVQAIANRELKIYPNAGHWLHHDQLEAFAADALEFLRD